MAATITALPTPPSRQSPATFSDRTDAFLAALPTFQSQANTLAAEAETNASTAATAASTATSAASSAAAISGATEWVSGTTYDTGDVVWSPSSFHTYRRKTDGAGTTDPSSDSTNWQPITSVATAQTYTGPKYTRDDDGTVSGGTWAIDYNNGPVIKATAGANITSITISNWPASGTEGHLSLRCVNFGAYTITFPAWNWIKSDMTVTTTFADLSLTLPSSGTAFIDLRSDDGGTTVYATVKRG